MDNDNCFTGHVEIMFSFLHHLLSGIVSRVMLAVVAILGLPTACHVTVLFHICGNLKSYIRVGPWLVGDFRSWWPGFSHRSCGICDGQSCTGIGFLQVLWFPMPLLIPPTAPYSLIQSVMMYSLYFDSIKGHQTYLHWGGGLHLAMPIFYCLYCKNSSSFH
jgi:hypothetical protein